MISGCFANVTRNVTWRSQPQGLLSAEVRQIPTLGDAENLPREPTQLPGPQTRQHEGIPGPILARLTKRSGETLMARILRRLICRSSIVGGGHSVQGH